MYSVVSVSVCVFVCLRIGDTDVLCKKAAPIVMPFVGLTLVIVGPANHVLDRGQDRTNPVAAARGDAAFCQITLDTRYYYYYYYYYYY